MGRLFGREDPAFVNVVSNARSGKFLNAFGCDVIHSFNQLKRFPLMSIDVESQWICSNKY
jgi:hypothetical protein